MSIPSEIRKQVRQRANFACEFCGVSETDRLLKQYKDLSQLLGQLNEQLVMLVEEQQQLLEEQRELIRFLLRRKQ
jgi:uncharacterized protein (DUF3084 family)